MSLRKEQGALVYEECDLSTSPNWNNNNKHQRTTLKYFLSQNSTNVRELRASGIGYVFKKKNMHEKNFSLLNLLQTGICTMYERSG